MPDWYLWAFGVSILFTGISTIMFSQISVKNINKQIKEAGHYYLCIDDKIGFTLLSMALAVLLPPRWAQRAIPPLFLNAAVAKELCQHPRDAILGLMFIVSISLFLIIGCFGGIYIP